MKCNVLLPALGVFLIIYFISMIFCGIPIFLLEVAIGQYLGSGGMTAISQLVPILKGLRHLCCPVQGDPSAQ